MDAFFDLVIDGTPEKIRAFMQEQPPTLDSLQLKRQTRIKAVTLCKEGKICLEQMQRFFSTEMLMVSKKENNLQTHKTKLNSILRLKSKKKYYEHKDIDNDDVMINKSKYGDEQIRKKMSKRKAHLMVKTQATFAAQTVPDDLILKDSEQKGALAGIFTFKEVKKGFVFGPYIGDRFEYRKASHDRDYCWDIYMHGKFQHCIDGLNANKSNWMRFINRTNSQLQNLEAFQQGYQVYYQTTKDLPARTELLVWQGRDYDQDFLKSTPPRTEIEDQMSQLDSRNGSVGGCVNVDSSISQLSGVTEEKKSAKKNSSTDFSTKRYKCNFCSYASDRKLSLFNHLKLHTKPYKCDTCNSSFSRLNHLKHHSRSHTGEKPYKCDICDKAFARTSHLNIHIRTHTGEKPYKCDVCGNMFSRHNHLKVHKRTHTGERPYKCNICNSAFSHRSNLTIHERIHTGEKPYKCDVCHSSFSVLTSFQVHKRTHTGERPFKCEICDSAFSQKFHLQNHIRTHTGEKPYECEVCGGAFSEASKLQRHKRIHTGEKPYKCVVCDSAFSQISHLQSHKRVHTGEKPYKCDICDSAFADKSYRNKHVKSVHTSVQSNHASARETLFSANSNNETLGGANLRNMYHVGSNLLNANCNIPTIGAELLRGDNLIHELNASHLNSGYLNSQTLLSRSGDNALLSTLALNPNASNSMNALPLSYNTSVFTPASLPTDHFSLINFTTMHNNSTNFNNNIFNNGSLSTGSIVAGSLNLDLFNFKV